MSGPAEEMAGESGQAEPPAGPPSAEALLEARSNRACQLRETAATLESEAHRLMTSFPEERDEDPIVFWKSGLDVMKGYLKEVTTLLEDCKLLVEQIGEVEQDADVADVAAFAAAGQDADQMELGALREGVTQCFAALYDAVQAWMTAFATLSNRRSSGSSRARQYRQAAAQLGEIAGHCQGLAGNLAGEADLP